MFTFFKTYYAPNNACIAVVGDFNESEAKRKIEHFFGAIPRQAPPPPPDVTELPILGEKRKELTDPLARLPRYEAAFKTVPGNDPDFEALSMLGTILSGGRTSRLYNAIVDRRIALNAQAGVFAGRGPGLFSFSASLPPTGTVKALEAAIDAEVLRVQRDGVTEEEVRRAKTQARARMIVGFGGGRGGGGGGGLQSVLGRANSLAQNAVFWNDPGRTNTQLQRIQAVTAADVKRVANKYLIKDHRVVVIVYPQLELTE